jgi:hypothetical protein
VSGVSLAVLLVALALRMMPFLPVGAEREIVTTT